MADDLTTSPGKTDQADGSRSGYPGGVSVVICTYNRRVLLQALVDSIDPQLSVSYPLEVIIVDNNSRDDTAAYARELAMSRPAFNYLFEPRQGLSYARNAGAAAARYEFLLYLDDDAILPPHYLKTLGRRLTDHDPDFFGGPLYPLYADPKPAWFPESLEIRKKTDRSGFHNSIVLTGANYGVRKSVLARVGGFDPHYGMVGGKVGMLEERLVIETYRRLVPPEQQKIYYGLDNFILNYTPAARMRVGFQLKRIFIGNAQFMRYSLQRGVRSPGILYRTTWRAFWGELGGVLRQAPQLWRERKVSEKPMLALVKLTYRGADLLGALDFVLTDFGKVWRRRQTEGGEARPLRATLFTLLRLEPGQALPPEISALRDAVADRAILTVVSIAGRSDDEIRDLANGLNLRAEDLLITDMPKAARALSPLRGSRPHLQIVLWIREPKPLNYLKNWANFWEKRAGLMGRLRRDRALLDAADQIVVSASWLTRPLAAALLPMRRRTLILPLAGPAREQAALGWRNVIEQARLWAPRRLAP